MPCFWLHVYSSLLSEWRNAIHIDAHIVTFTSNINKKMRNYSRKRKRFRNRCYTINHIYSISCYHNHIHAMSRVCEIPVTISCYEYLVPPDLMCLSVCARSRRNNYNPWVTTSDKLVNLSKLKFSFIRNWCSVGNWLSPYNSVTRRKRKKNLTIFEGNTKLDNH